MLKGLLNRFSAKQPKTIIQPEIIQRENHNISRKFINPNALKVLYRLHHSGFSAYLVGGCVRDLLLGIKPKDFDIATDAHPEEVRKLFRNCRLIGKRFRLAHIIFGRDIIEVATFRAHHENSKETHAKKSHTGMIVRDNVYGLIEDDVLRRDFTINALYYNIADFSIVDFMSGMEDIQSKTIRMIGDPEKRYQEDPVRILRAIRTAGKLKFHLSPETEAPIRELNHLLQQVAPARLFTEVLKFFQSGETLFTFELLKKYHLLNQLFPQTEACLKNPSFKQLIETALTHTDQRIKLGKTVSPVFLLSVFLWGPILQEIKSQQGDFPKLILFENAIQTVLKKQSQQVAIPRRLMMDIREICLLQYRFARQGSRAYRLLGHPRFRAAYDLLLLRAESEKSAEKTAVWWKAFYLADPEEREKMIKKVHIQKNRNVAQSEVK